MRGATRERSAILAALLATALASACQDDASPPAAPAPAGASDQTFEQAMRVACDAPDQPELAPDAAGGTNRALLIAVWIDRRVRNREVRQLIGGSAAQTPQGKLEALRAGARRAGITHCALAELWQAPTSDQ
jgi:hypothetical protein